MQTKDSGGLGVHAADPRFHSKDSYGRYILVRKCTHKEGTLLLIKIQLNNTIRQPFFYKIQVKSTIRQPFFKEKTKEAFFKQNT